MIKQSVDQIVEFDCRIVSSLQNESGERLPDRNAGCRDWLVFREHLDIGLYIGGNLLDRDVPRVCCHF